MSKIFTTMVGSDDGSVYKVDTIEYEGGLWLVPHWTVSPTEGLRRPTRIIRMDILPHQKGGGNFGDYILSGPIPKAVLDGVTPPEQAHGFVVRLRPDVSLPGGDKLN